MKVGDIRYKVYTGYDYIPWIGRCKVIRISPKGHSITFNAIDKKKSVIFKDVRGGNMTSKTKVEALKKYQSETIKSYHWEKMFKHRGVFETMEQRVKAIIKAQELIDKIMFCPSI